MLQVIIIILVTSFVLYTLLGGADFGAGIVETFRGNKGEKDISKAMAPVWEANHV
jgi:cytochrome d ubiquinol oxidase subunit II